MNKNIQNKNAFSLVIAIWLVLVMTLMAYFILDYMVPFSRNIKWIENATNAYYQSENGIEQAIFQQKSLWVWEEALKTLSSIPIDYSYNITAMWKRLPPLWEWNSGFHPDFNKIRIGEPIQLEVWWRKISSLNNFKLYFRVPFITNASGATLSWTTATIINWQLTSSTDTLNASWSWIYWSDILRSDDTKNVNLWTSPYVAEVFSTWWWHENWLTLDWSWVTFNDFYWTTIATWNCYWTASWCILKLSITNDLVLTSNNIKVPYLEWAITYNSNIPLRYSHISSSWKSYWFKKSLKIKIPQQTVNEVFDFTVFQ